MRTSSSWPNHIPKASFPDTNTVGIGFQHRNLGDRGEHKHSVHNTKSLLLYYSFIWLFRASQVALVVKNLPASARDARDTDSIPGSGRSPRVGSGSPSLQYSCLGNPMDRGAWGRKELYTIEQLSTFIALFVVGEDLWDNLFPTSLRYDWQNFIYLGCIMWFFLGVCDDLIYVNIVKCFPWSS